MTDGQKYVLRGCGIFLLLWSIFVAICLLLSSCRSIKTEVQYEYRDSVITHYVTDTTHVLVTDTARVEIASDTQKENETEIHFGVGGGTWNAQTGEATNVISVKQANRAKELQSMVLSQKHTIDSLAAANDALQHSITEIKDDEHIQQNTKAITPRSGWDRFCTWWTIGSWVLALLALAWWVFEKIYLH